MGLFNRKPKIGKLKREKNVEGLIKAFSYKDNAIRQKSADALTDIFKNDPKVVIMAIFTKDKRVLEEFFASSSNEELSVRWASIWMMGHFWSLGDLVVERISIPILAALHDESYAVRTVAARGLSASQNKQFIKHLTSAKETETNPTVLKAILGSLEQLNKIES